MAYFSVGRRWAPGVDATRPISYRAAGSWKFAGQLAVVFIAYLIAGKLGQATTAIRSSNLGPVWPAYGIALAAFLNCGYRVWPAIALSAFVVAAEGAVSPLAAAGQTMGATLGSLTGMYFLRRIPDFDPLLPRLRDALGLVAFGAFGSALISSSIGILSLYATGVQPYSGVGAAWAIYWLGDSTGVLIVTPLLFTLPQLVHIRSHARLLELASLLTLLTVGCAIVFGAFPAISIRLDALAFAVLPLVMWGAINFGIAGATCSVFLVAVLATVLTAVGHGPFAQNTPFTNAVLLDVLFAVLAVSGLSLAAVIAERERAERDRERLIREQTEMDARLHERARIARELHDDVGQRLALLTSRLSNVSEDLHQEAFRIAAAVQELSHELHPSSLDVRGIVAAIRSFCREFAEQQNVKIDVDAQDISARLPSEVSITLFRVLQEALHNAAKHSGTRHCEVMLRQRDGRIRLVVCDRGAGFDPEMAQRGRGIGLTTMRERVELIGGRLSIASRRKQGTRIDADVPITLNGQ